MLVLLFLLISRLINRSGLRTSHSKVFSSEGIIEMKRFSIDPQSKSGYLDPQTKSAKSSQLCFIICPFFIFYSLSFWFFQGVWNRGEIQLTRAALPYVYACFADGYSICIRNIQSRLLYTW